MDSDLTELMRARVYADEIDDIQRRYMEGLRQASNTYAQELEKLRIQYDAGMAHALTQRGW